MIAAASAAAPSAAGADGITVRLRGAERHLSPADVTAAVDRPAGSYLLRAAGTAAEPVAHPPALSVRRLVTVAGGSPDALSFLTIERPNGSTARLGRGDLSDPAPFADGPPIVWIDAGGARYVRPLRSATDVNAADNVGITSGDLVVRVYQGPLLAVRARADRRSVPAGTDVALTADVTGAAPGAAPTVSWTFGDGTAKPGTAVGHAFRSPGVYEVVATVSGADDSGGSSDPLRIRVGNPPKGAGDTGGGTARRTRAPAQGPARGGDAAGGGSAGRPAPGNSAPSTSAPSPAPPADGPPAPAKRRARRPTPAPPRRATAPSRPRPRPVRRPASPPRRPSGPVIQGTLVAARTVATLPGDAARVTGARPAARRGRDAPAPPLGPVAGILAAAALLGLGMRRERRDLHRRLKVT